MKNSGILFILLWLMLSNGLLDAQTRLETGVRKGDHELVMPWVGGMNAPQFSNIDLNRDGITDMISFDRQGDILRCYIHLPASGRWIHTWEYAYFFPELHDWVLTADYNGDGIEDLFTSSILTGVAGVTVFKGSYENDIWAFEKQSDRDKDYLQIDAGGGLTNLYVSWDDIPSIVDVDGDTDLDILAFEPGGSYIFYYKNISIESGWGRDSLRFVLADPCWGKIYESEFTEEVFLSESSTMCSDGNFTGGGDIIRTRHSGSTVLTLDFDFDGDREALLGDITSSHLVFLHNEGTATQGWMTQQETSFPAHDVSIELPYFVSAFSVELDDDPEPEILASINSRALAEDRESVWRYDDDVLTDGPLLFELTQKGWLQDEMIDIGTHSRPVFVDINGDELKDMIIGAYHFTTTSETRIPSLWYFKNIGTAESPYFSFVTEDYLGMSQFAANPTFDFAPAFGDIDNNGTIDMVVGDQNGKLFFYKNNAAPGDSFLFETPVYPYMNIAVGVSATPQIADINGDGLSDLIIGERTGNADMSGRCSVLNYFQNIGSPGNAMFNGDPAMSPNTPCYGRVLFDIPVGLPQYSTPVIVRTENGLVMLVGNDHGTFRLYGDLQNGITGSLTLLEDNYGNIDAGHRSAPMLADINNDKKFELVIGNVRGGVELFSTELIEGITSVSDPNSVDQKPYTLIHHRDENRWEILWHHVQGNVRLFDLNGRLIQLQLKDGNIDLNSFLPGMYFLSVEVNGNVFGEKIVRY